MSVNYYRASQNAYGHGRIVLREMVPTGTDLHVFAVGSLDIEATTGDVAGAILAHWQGCQE